MNVLGADFGFFGLSVLFWYTMVIELRVFFIREVIFLIFKIGIGRGEKHWN